MGFVKPVWVLLAERATFSHGNETACFDTHLKAETNCRGSKNSFTTWLTERGDGKVINAF